MHVHISFKEALKAACLVGTPGPLWGRALPQNGTPTMITQADINAFVEASETGKYEEMSLVIARPFIEHRMMSAVLAVAGTDTGATLFGPAGARRRLSGLCMHSPALAPLTRPLACVRRHADLGEHVGQDDRGPLHVPHPVGDHQAAERDGAPRHHVRAPRPASLFLCAWQLTPVRSTGATATSPAATRPSSARARTARTRSTTSATRSTSASRWPTARTSTTRRCSPSRRSLTPRRRATRSSRSPTACCRGTRRTATRASSSRAARRAGCRRAARASRASTTVRHAAWSVPFPPSPRLFFTPRPLPVHRRGPARHLESRFYCGVDGQQLDLLPRPAPRLLAVERDVPGIGARARALRPRRAPGGAHATRLQSAQFAQFALLAHTPLFP